MVAGDLVNTASRVQSVAEPGTVLVGEATAPRDRGRDRLRGRREHELKGKAEPVAALAGAPRRRGRGGEGRSTGARGAVRRARPRAPAREGALPRDCRRGQGAPGLRDRRRRHRQVPTGVGVLQVHRRPRRHRPLAPRPMPGLRRRGRVLGARRDGPDRAGIAEDEAPTTAARSSATSSSSMSTIPTSARWIEPRLAHLLGLAERGAPRSGGPLLGLAALLRAAGRGKPDRAGLRGPALGRRRACSTSSSTCSSGRATYPLFVLTLGRPELLERRPIWGAGTRNFTSLFLEPLADARWTELLAGLVPGLPDELRARIPDRAEGVPLYAVETVRMLLDRGVLVRRTDASTGSTGDGRRPRGSGDAARAYRRPADGLEPAERRLARGRRGAWQDLHQRRASALSGADESEVEPLPRLARAQGDPRPSRRPALPGARASTASCTGSSSGSRTRPFRRRSARPATWLSAGYLEGGRARRGRDRRGRRRPLPGGVSGGSGCRGRRGIRAQACDGSPARASAPPRWPRTRRRAATSSRPPSSRTPHADAAELLERAGEAAGQRGSTRPARTSNGPSRSSRRAARRIRRHASARLGQILHDLGRIDEAVERMEQAFPSLGGRARR